MPTINKPKRRQQYESLDAKRKERMQIYNTARWKELRLTKLRQDPLCERCKEEGRITPADDIHHITSFMSSNDFHQRRFLAFDMNNLKSLCDKCHQREHN